MAYHELKLCLHQPFEKKKSRSTTAVVALTSTKKNVENAKTPPSLHLRDGRGCRVCGGESRSGRGGREAVWGGRVGGRETGGTLSNSLSGLLTSLNQNILNRRGGWAPNRDAFEFAHALEFAQAPPDPWVRGSSRTRTGGEGFEKRSFPQRSTANTLLLRLRGGWAPNRDPRVWGRASLQGHGNSPTRAGEEGFDKRSFAHRITARDLQVLSKPLETPKP
jgi:hypothetical protein